MIKVRLSHVEKVYAGGVKAVKDFNLEILEHEFVVLVGPSGCGKSTTLRMIAGLEDISSGTIAIEERIVNDVSPKDRDIAMVFQNYALYPHMTVFDNMAFGLKLRKYKSSEIKARVNEAAEILGIKELLKRRPKQLSGGQRQRVAVGRAIVRKPKLFLFDEPLSNLDAKMRVQMRVEISRLHHSLGATMLYVTHDQTEAMTMGERIVVMNNGIIQQVASPLEIYDNPANRFVAGFIGTPPMNLFEGTLERAGGVIFFNSSSLKIPLPEKWTTGIEKYVSKPVVFGIRPEDIGSQQAEELEGAPRISACVDVTEPMGSETYLYLKSGSHDFVSRVDAHREVDHGSEISVAILVSRTHLFEAEGDGTLIV